MTKIYTLLSQTDRHPKISKNGKVGIFSAVMHLSPADSSGYEVCPMRSAGCTEACLNYAGFQYKKKYEARIARTKWYFEDRPAFMMKLGKEIELLVRRAEKVGLAPGIRLNGTSDIPWENVMMPGTDLNMMEFFPRVKFMDYTKRYNRTCLPKNYRLVFSRSEENEEHCVIALDNGMNVAVVFEDELPEMYTIGDQELCVIDGDEHDWRYGDYDIYPDRVVVGLRAKGIKARQDTSGFVVRRSA